ncbi:hypothetical protein [Agromyces sp. M3QZ16-3]|uniref:hypothetical protein n=1 Tax=Agromyces sp. M3QZ16-3 TaxID=3447585 RepID=UPI003F68CEEC
MTAIAVGPEAVVLRDDEGRAVETFPYADEDAAPALTAIEALLGPAPEVEEHPGSQEHQPVTSHRWPGFRLEVVRYVDGWVREDLVPTRAPAFRVTLDAPVSGSVALVTLDGFHVGDAWTSVTGASAYAESPADCAHGFTDAIEQAVTWYDGSDRIELVVVDLVPGSDLAALTQVRAPVAASGCV